MAITVPEWFNGGRFYGAGPWFHGPNGFYGHVNHGYDPRYGYRGGFPGYGDYREPEDHFRNFHGTHEGDGRGHERGFGYGNGKHGDKGKGGDYGNGKDHGGDHGNGHGHGHD